MDNFRERGGVIGSLGLLFAFVAIGFSQMAINALLGPIPTVGGDWMASMATMSAGALGYLIGKQTSGPVNSTTVSTTSPSVIDATVTNTPLGSAP